MLTKENIDKVCAICLAIMLGLSAILMGAGSLILSRASAEPAYVNRLFDTSYVHEIAITYADWDGFLQSCTDEEYINVSIAIDGEQYTNVALRAKGNTSLTQVASYGNNRYSFKVEFDHYKSSCTYHGLDKLCLNNMIQDSTYLKDYLAYTFMNKAGVDAPLVSFVWITVNGEDWGLYLAVEGIEDAFLSRIGASAQADLYKPDSLSFGGGRGNGKGFEMDDFMEEFEAKKAEFEGTDAADDTTGESAEVSSTPQMPGGMSMPGGGGMQMPDSSSMQMPDSGSMQMPDSGSMQMPDSGSMQMPDSGSMQMPDSSTDSGSTDSSSMQIPGDFSSFDFSSFDFSSFELPEGMEMPGGGAFGMGSDDVKLVYTDDEFDSYSNIFNSAKTTVTDTDKQRLINALKQLSEGDVEECLDTESVITYMAVHNFLVNSDSYTGSMVHNYYLLEEGGKLSMIPWDYNLAFGTMMGGQASSSVNSPIDTIASSDRPMATWIMNSEEYLAEYHEVYAEFIAEVFDSGWFSEELERVISLISPYVEKDPTAFYSYDEFTTGVTALQTFIELRVESVKGQLDGSIPSTESGQTNSDALIDTGDLSLSDMGTMNNSMGGGMGGFDMPSMGDMSSAGSMPSMGGMSGGFAGGEQPDAAAAPETTGTETSEKPGKSEHGESEHSTHGAQMDFSGLEYISNDSNQSHTKAYIMLAASFALLAAALCVSKRYKTRE